MLGGPCGVPRRAWSWPWRPRAEKSGQGVATRAGILPSEATAGSRSSLQKALTIAREIGNPPQLWQTYQALGEFFEQLGQRSGKVGLHQPCGVIDEVANRLQDQELKHTCW